MKTLLVICVLACASLVAQERRSPPNSVALKPPDTLQTGKTFENQILILDGMKCSGCSFKNLTFLYSGGQYNLKDAKFSGTIAVEFHGPAENGTELLSSLSGAETKARTIINLSEPKTLSLKNTW